MSTVGRVRAKDSVEGITVLACHNCHNYAHVRGLKKTQKKIMYRKFTICLGFGSSLAVRLVSSLDFITLQSCERMYTAYEMPICERRDKLSRVTPLRFFRHTLQPGFSIQTSNGP